MDLPRPERELDLEREKIIEQFRDCAMHHSRFLGQDKLSPAQEIQLQKLATYYVPYRYESGLADLEEAGRKIIAIDAKDWRSKEPLERYATLHKQRAMDLEHFTHGFLKAAGVTQIPNQLRLDVGTGSSFFVDYMSHLEQQREDWNGEVWFGVDIPESKSAVTQSTRYDRDTNPAFFEFKAGEKLPEFLSTPYYKEPVGLTTLNYVLHHVDERQIDGLIDNIYERTAPGGYVLILEDNIGEYQVDPFKKAFVKAQDDFFYPDFPGNQKTMHEWSMLMQKHGFEIVRHGDAAMYNSAGIMTRDAVILARKPL